MIRASIAFFIIALVAFALGAGGIAGMSMEIGKMLLVVFIVLAAVSLLGSLITGRKPKQLL
jgi:uncharacterized membrane protein YtjA (UPF0391 family)